MSSRSSIALLIVLALFIYSLLLKSIISPCRLNRCTKQKPALHRERCSVIMHIMPIPRKSPLLEMWRSYLQSSACRRNFFCRFLSSHRNVCSLWDRFEITIIVCNLSLRLMTIWTKIFTQTVAGLSDAPSSIVRIRTCCLQESESWGGRWSNGYSARVHDHRTSYLRCEEIISINILLIL